MLEKTNHRMRDVEDLPPTFIEAKIVSFGSVSVRNHNGQDLVGMKNKMGSWRKHGYRGGGGRMSRKTE
ncbi:unnamed protein product [Lactuca virosa]|uniref:Uncharacterized protein n=1 Tax=Lactuca virosa TaxID=75947 RepID=A0AAU9LF69_9ASTR|nr:unnamed protein product [Lactuca virosa]